MLYIPDSTVRLISIRCLAQNSNIVTHFDQDSCWLTDKSENSVIAHGTLQPHTNLYALSLYNSTFDHAYAIHSMASLETWHRWLGHANYNSIVDMAKYGLLKGAPLHITPTLVKCKFCIVDKQTKTSIPKLHGGGAGNQATRKLEKVWVDLTGPQDVESRTGNRYIMNIVDDYTSYPWSILLKTKDKAFSKLVIWQCERETETGLKVGIYHTDKGGTEKRSDGRLAGIQRDCSPVYCPSYFSAHWTRGANAQNPDGQGKNNEDIFRSTLLPMGLTVPHSITPSH